MTRAKRFVGFWAAIVALLASFVLASGASAQDKKPNILIIWVVFGVTWWARGARGRSAPARTIWASVS
jgi:hypothetical protein